MLLFGNKQIYFIIPAKELVETMEKQSRPKYILGGAGNYLLDPLISPILSLPGKGQRKGD